ncbi:hypothetical protein AB4084_38750, partial [Lysobacter sp. 2RAB21]
CKAWLAVSGFGAYDLLRGESGLHVFEELDDGVTRRVSLSVQVAPDLPGRARVAQAASDGDKRSCRRYRQSPSPLVRDGVRGWRSGRL